MFHMFKFCFWHFFLECLLYFFIEKRNIKNLLKVLFKADFEARKLYLKRGSDIELLFTSVVK